MLFKLYPPDVTATPTSILMVDNARAVDARVVIMSAVEYYNHRRLQERGVDRVEYIKVQLEQSGILFYDLMQDGIAINL